MERLRVLYPRLDSQLPNARITGTILAKDHPERRYAKSELWTKEEAQLAVQTAAEIYSKIVPNLVLNGLIYIQDI
jgi:hypothetical protein